MRAIQEKSFKEFFTNYPATTTILIVTILLHLASYVFGNGPSDFETARKFGALMSSNKDLSELPYMLTSTYQHIGGMMHLLMNMGFILISAPYLEQLFGSFRLVILYNLTGISGSFVTLLFMDNALSSGASAAAYGLMGIYLVLMLLKRVTLTEDVKQTVKALFVIGIIMTFVVPNISVTGHLGGLFAGMILGSFFPFTRKKSIPTQGVMWALLIPVVFLILLSVPQYAVANEWAQNLFANDLTISDIPFISNQATNPQDEVVDILKTIQQD